MARHSFWLSGRTLAVCALIAVVGYLLVRDHILQYLPFAILLLCPLMHLFMHAGHSGHREDGMESPEEAYRRGVEEGRKTQALGRQD